MNVEKLKTHMLDFSLESLKQFLGMNLVDTLLEWTSDERTPFTKGNLIDMIISVHGLNILKNNNFRNALLHTFSKKQLATIGQALNVSCGDEQSYMDVIEKASDISWRDNKVNRAVLEMLDIGIDVFDKPVLEETTVNNISSQERFYELLDYQFVIKQRIINELNSKSELNRMLVHMPTGTGKTKTAMHTLCHYYNFSLKKSGLIIWIAHTTELLIQAYDTFSTVWNHLGNGDIKACKLWGNHNIDENNFDYNGIVFCGIQKLMSMSNSAPAIIDNLIQNCSLIVFDEAHKAAASETKNIIERFMIKKPEMCDRALLGLTATPGRFTELSVGNDLLASMFGNKIIQIDTEIMNYINMSKIDALNTKAEDDIIAYFQQKHILAKVRKQQLTYPDKLSPEELKSIRTAANQNGYDDFTQKALETLGRNKSRNLSIMRKLRELNTLNMPTIVFACSVEHGQLLSSMLSIEGIPNALVIGDMLPQDRKNAISAFKDKNNPINILINYEVLTTGFDSTNIKCVFIARPTQSVVLYSQMLGRGLRGPQMGGNEECLLVDIKDNLEKYNESLAFNHFNNYWKV